MSIENKKNTPPTAQNARGGKSALDEDDGDWLQRAQNAYESSTNYMDSNLRKGFDDGLRAFNNMHSGDSKYNNPAYSKRSTLYRPKTRSIIRKNEAAAAAAFFSNMEVVSITATDTANKKQQASAEIMKELLQYRLTKSIPWFQTLIGGLQDAQTTGVVMAHIYWDYKASPEVVAADVQVTPQESVEETEYPEQNNLPMGAMSVNEEGSEMTKPMTAKVEGNVVAKMEPTVDKPCIDLIPVENIRIDPGANWIDPINTSPYIIHMIPMYAMDVKDKMRSGDWRRLSDGYLGAASMSKTDSTRMARNKDRDDPYQVDNKAVDDYEVIWVQRHIHRKGDEDYEFYTLSDIAMLTPARPLKETVFHGKRPYVMGCTILESHKLYPTSVPQLSKGLQDEANEVVNQRLDNVKFVLNKKFLVKRGKEADVGGLLRNVPGGVALFDDPINDVRELTWPDVTASAYEEQSRIDTDLNDLVGNFSPGQVMADHGIAGPARNMAMLAQSSGTLVEYMLRTFTETFVLPVLRQLVLLEQEYETDEKIFSVVGSKVKLFDKFGVDKVTDDILREEVTLTVNVGMGSTDPERKLQKFIAGMGFYANLVKQLPTGMNLQEVGKELFGHLGYQDGARFFTSDNPQVLALQQQLQQAMQQINQMQSQIKEKQTGHQVKVAVADLNNKTKLLTTQMHENAENQRNVTTHLRAIAEMEKLRTHEINKANLDRAHSNAMRQGSPKTMGSNE